MSTLYDICTSILEKGEFKSKDATIKFLKEERTSEESSIVIEGEYATIKQGCLRTTMCTEIYLLPAEEDEEFQIYLYCYPEYVVVWYITDNKDYDFFEIRITEDLKTICFDAVGEYLKNRSYFLERRISIFDFAKKFCRGD